MKSVTVSQLVKCFKLEVITGEEHLERTITKSKAHRPGLEFVGYFDFFPTERVQVLGKKEINYLLTRSEQERDHYIGNIVSYKPPCFIVTSDLEELTYLTKHCIDKGIPLLRTNETTTEFIIKVDGWLIKMLAPEISIHGVCVNVSGIGILLRGKSGVGKSETAHTLIRRGHRLIADDVVVLKKLSPQTLLGTHDSKTREFLALRSIGLINVVRIYGRRAFQDETRIALDIELTEWKENSLNNDLEVKPQMIEYMDVSIPHFEIQLQPGRDVAGLIEAAANNWYLRQQGYSAAEEFIGRLNEEFNR